MGILLSGVGGGLRVTGRRVTLQDCVFDSNRAAYGGSVYAEADIINCIIDGSASVGTGGGLYLLGESSVISSRVSGSADCNHPAIQANGPTEIDGCTISGSFGLAFLAAIVNLVMGMVIVWVLVRYRFPGRRIFDAIVDIPFALPTAVAGVALTALFAQKGWLGAPLAEWGIKVAFTPIGIFVAMIFIGFPFVVRTVQPVLIDLEIEVEEAASSLGASRWDIIRRVILPSLTPAILTGFALAFARAVGDEKIAATLRPT